MTSDYRMVDESEGSGSVLSENNSENFLKELRKTA
jgi:hypothetical protein